MKLEYCRTTANLRLAFTFTSWHEGVRHLFATALNKGCQVLYMNCGIVIDAWEVEIHNFICLRKVAASLPSKRIRVGNAHVFHALKLIHSAQSSSRIFLVGGRSAHGVTTFHFKRSRQKTFLDWWFWLISRWVFWSTDKRTWDQPIITVKKPLFCFSRLSLHENPPYEKLYVVWRHFRPAAPCSHAVPKS